MTEYAFEGTGKARRRPIRRGGYIVFGPTKPPVHFYLHRHARGVYVLLIERVDGRSAIGYPGSRKEAQEMLRERYPSPAKVRWTVEVEQLTLIDIPKPEQLPLIADGEGS